MLTSDDVAWVAMLDRMTFRGGEYCFRNAPHA